MIRQGTGHPAYDELVSGEVQGSATAAQCPDVKANFFEIAAATDNVGNVYLGGAGVTKPDGTTDVLTGIHLAPGQSRYFFIPNLNLLYRICDNAGDDFVYLGYK